MTDKKKKTEKKEYRGEKAKISLSAGSIAQW
jgi:hypothetical protein